MNITEIIVPQQEVAWLPWAVQYFFFIGMAATAAILVALGEFNRGGRLARLQAPALLVAVSTGVVAPIALLADLHQPGRFYHFYTDITLWSWMSIGALILPVFLTGLFGYFLLWQWGQGFKMTAVLRRPLALAMLVGGLGILLYTGSEVVVVKARALWNTQWLIVNLAATALMATSAAILFVQAKVLRAEPVEQQLALRLFLAATTLTGLGALGWALTGWWLASPSFIEFTRLLSQFAYWQSVFVASVVVGLGLLLATLAMLQRPHRIVYAVWLAPFALLAAWSFRWAVLMDVQSVPKYGAGLYPYELPLGSDGLLGIVGIFGLWLAVLIILPSLFSSRTNEVAAHG